jgi:hypothetical protein
MARQFAKGSSVAAAALMLASCLDPQTVPLSEINAPPPIGYRATAIEYVKTTFVDPYSVRDASISQPFPIRGGLTGQTTVWYVCIKANAKNRMGGYTGLSETPLVFEGNTINKSNSEVIREYIPGSTLCKPAKYEPFPEIEMKA